MAEVVATARLRGACVGKIFTMEMHQQSVDFTNPGDYISSNIKGLGKIVKAFYFNREIVLRERISNASDALDKIRYEFVTDQKKFEAQPNCYIKIIPDKTNPEDSGIGIGLEFNNDENFCI
eukprot:CAMPEP_0115473662 /NCGR_PEP_ID=MMETSP0271-20121206/53686_1 /TAXON_ID=71861 /ORGANISM="Scrippsiella trochoidea, Strain CCMP3099" /LENGTH=120 /DNA_ID=CAMNT_0002900949 /DNA_START=10 /DNA_END=372 /DNA_ORIENTATION=-